MRYMIVVKASRTGEGLEAEIEIRRVFELEDFEQNDAIERFRKLEAERMK